MKTELENAKIELITWLNDECPKVFAPLESYTTDDLSHDFAEKLRERLDNIIILKGRIAENQEIDTNTPFFGNSGAKINIGEKGNGAEEILSRLTGIPIYRLKANDKGEYITKLCTLKAMHENARSELIQFLSECIVELPEGKDCIDLVDEYLKSRPDIKQEGELNDIINCIIGFDDKESLEDKGKYFEIIQKDLKAMRDGKITHR
jgi:hypothetical protein